MFKHNLFIVFFHVKSMSNYLNFNTFYCIGSSKLKYKKITLGREVPVILLGESLLPA